MQESTLSLLLSILALVVSVFALATRRGPAPKQADDNGTRPLQLQAYERLVILCERISLPNLISRVNQPDLNARQMQFLLTDNLKQEFEYNASQQIYVSQAAWDAVRNLRDQSLLIINSIAKALPPEAQGRDLNKGILEALLSQENAALHTLALDTLSGEAKKIM